MSLAARIRWNSLFALSSSGIRLATNVILFVGIARFFGPEGFGQFTTAHTLAGLFLLLADFGFDVLLTTEVARQRERASELVQQFLTFKGLFSLIAIAGMWLVPMVQEVSQSTRLLIFIFSFHVAFTALTNFFFALFKGFEQLQHETKVAFLTNLVLFCALIVLGILGASLEVVAVTFVATRALGLFTAIWVARKFILLPKLRFSVRGWRSSLKLVSVFGVHLIFANLFFQLDTILIAFWRGDHDVGIYQSVFKMVVLVLFLPDVVINALMPVLSRFHRESVDRWNTLGKLMNKTLFLVALPIALVFFVYADQLIEIVYGGRGFAEAIPILRIFAIIVLVRFGVEAYALMLTTSRRQSTRMFIVMLATAFNFALNAYLIPRNGIMGAAFASLATNFFVGLGYIVTTRSFLPRWTIDLHSLVPFLVTIALAGILWQIRTIPVWYTAPIAVAIVSVVSYFVGFTRDERETVFSLEKKASIV